MYNMGMVPFELLALGIWLLPPLAWTALYFWGATARDLLYWGAISVVIPILGPGAALIFALRLKRKREKEKRQPPEPRSVGQR